MALTIPEKTQLSAIIAREGGLTAFSEALKDQYATKAKADALADLSAAITVTVSDWSALRAFVSKSSNAALYVAMDEISGILAGAQSVVDGKAVIADSKDASKLGPLFIALYAAAKVHFSK